MPDTTPNTTDTAVKPTNFEAPPIITDDLRVQLGLPKEETERIALDYTLKQKEKVESIVKKTFEHMYGVSKFAIKGISNHHEEWMRFALLMGNFRLTTVDEVKDINNGTAANQTRGVLPTELVDWSLDKFKLPTTMARWARKYNRRGFNSNVERRGALVNKMPPRIGVAKNRGHGAAQKSVSVKKENDENYSYSLQKHNDSKAVKNWSNAYKRERDWGDKMLQSISPTQQGLFLNFRPEECIFGTSASDSDAVLFSTESVTSSIDDNAVATLEKEVSTLKLLLQREKTNHETFIATATNNLVRKDKEILKLNATLNIERGQNELLEEKMKKYKTIIESAEASANDIAIEQAKQQARAVQVLEQQEAAEEERRATAARAQEEKLARLEKVAEDKKVEEELRAKKEAEVQQLAAIKHLEKVAEDKKEEEELRAKKEEEELLASTKRKVLKKKKEIAAQELANKKHQLVERACEVINEKAPTLWTPSRAVSLICFVVFFGYVTCDLILFLFIFYILHHHTHTHRLVHQLVLVPTLKYATAKKLPLSLMRVQVI